MPDLKKPRIPAYRLHKPSGRAVVRLNGRDFYLGPHGTPESKAEYERLISEWLANHRQLPEQRSVAGHLMTSDLTVNELLVAFWDFAQEYYVKNGRPTGEQQALKYAMVPVSFCAACASRPENRMPRGRGRIGR